MNGLIDSFKSNKAVREILDHYGAQLKKLGVVILIGLVIMGGYSLLHGSQEAQVQLTERSAQQESSGVTDGADGSSSGDASGIASGIDSDGMIFVDIGGAVKTPMLAELPDGSRVDDAIKAAGGLRDEADMTSVNRAEFLVDGQKIFIPSYALDEDGNIIESAGVSDNAAGAAAQTGAQEGKVNINTADSDQLQTLNGVGPATAQKIIDYRDSSGRFTTIEDLKNVSGIGDKTFEKLKDHVCV